MKVAIVGGGIIGLATALELLRRFPGIALAIIEKEPVVASHQTSHNSGVIHSGIYYKPGSLKAKLCVEGRSEMLRFCEENSIPYELCGKTILATVESERPRLAELFKRGVVNGLVGLRMLAAEEIKELEPHAVGLQGIHVPGTAIVDFGEVARKYAELISKQGGSFFLSHEVTALMHTSTGQVVQTTRGAIDAEFVINCAGLQSDRVSRMAGVQRDLMIVPFRGEYYDLNPAKHDLVRGLVYPVPDPRFPFLGVHFTRRIRGGVEAGPNAVLALKREGYSGKSFDAGDVLDYATFPGFWKMAGNHWRMSLAEYHRSWSKPAFVRALQGLIPELRSEDLLPGGSGVRAQALDVNGTMLDDFRFFHTEGMVHVCNVPSPAATASLAIGRHIVDIIATRAELSSLTAETKR